MILAILIYLLLLNIVSFCLMGTDKKRAKEGAFRIPEKTLFAVSILGGALGAWIGMYLFRHKTRHWYFVVGIPVILIVHLVISLWIMLR